MYLVLTRCYTKLVTIARVSAFEPVEKSRTKIWTDPQAITGKHMRISCYVLAGRETRVTDCKCMMISYELTKLMHNIFKTKCGKSASKKRTYILKLQRQSSIAVDKGAMGHELRHASA
ncbi:hypothetical protein PUN28_017966 [Cardiocondyla obscurior]|uniref:Uncharacterized protein n=1 Tax=Cardiocondyla obscurior TaxID=286306 RepID=A0AAW2EJ46_9HYME